MRTLSKIVIGAMILIGAVSCGNNAKVLLPNVSGKAGEVIIVVGKDNWEGNLGNEIGSLLARDCSTCRKGNLCTHWSTFRRERSRTCSSFTGTS